MLLFLTLCITLFFIMKNYSIHLISTLLLLSLWSCGSKESAYHPQTGSLFVFADDSCYAIRYDDNPIFAIKANTASLYYNDRALFQNEDGMWGYIDSKGETALSSLYDRATVFSEGLAWVIKGDDMPGAINEKGDVKISLRGTERVRVFHEGRAAFLIKKKNKFLWGFIDKNGHEVVKPQYKNVKDFRLGLAPVQDDETALWGYINLNHETVIGCQYNEAYPFNDEGKAIVKSDDRYFVINRQGDVLTKHNYAQMRPDHSWAMIQQENLWGWCNEKGEIAITPAFEACRPFGANGLAPVKIRGKWGYINREGKVVIKRQFTEAYPFLDGCAAVKTGTVWGFINDKGTFTVNPQYDFISQDYLYQVLGDGCAYSTLNIE